jgi:hypothetical protein
MDSGEDTQSMIEAHVHDVYDSRDGDAKTRGTWLLQKTVERLASRENIMVVTGGLRAVPDEPPTIRPVPSPSRSPSRQGLPEQLQVEPSFRCVPG